MHVKVILGRQVQRFELDLAGDWDDKDLLSELGLSTAMNTVSITKRDGKSASATITRTHQGSCLRVFISGDRSQVGKSTVCLGLLTALLGKYKPSDLCYIKPATQCESTQLIWKFCENQGIKCQGIGPIVFYSGFTRAFLKGETESSEQLLQKAKEAVEKIS